MIKFFVTGSTGFIGSHLVKYLINQGHHVKCLVRKHSNNKWLKELAVEYVYGDMFDVEVLRKAVADVDYIYHIAGVTASKTKRGYFLGNQEATRNLLIAAETNSNLKRFVFAGSLAAVGPSTDGKPVNEESELQPITTYGRSKMAAEKEVLSFQNKIPFTIVRIPAVYGPRDTATLDFFKSVNNGIIPLVGFKSKYVNILHVNDVVDGLILAGEHPDAAGKIYFIGSEKAYTWEDIGRVTQKIIQRKTIKLRIPEFIVVLVASIYNLINLFSRKPSVLNFEKSKDIIADAWICDSSKAKKELGFQQKITLEEGVKETFKWYKEVGWIK
ncbi:MAG: NAD-dependent epimerase/dehydratase family protein [Bacteroidota bacterium]|nr:NAD-dependent epimerase/dehydratase family protein [Bacteroidota bacterium]